MRAIRLIPEELAERWCVLETTLSQWRWFGKGPGFLKMGSRILYRLEDIERFEALNIQTTEIHANDVAFSKIQLEEVS